jgi:hypothetical protein
MLPCGTDNAESSRAAKKQCFPVAPTVPSRVASGDAEGGLCAALCCCQMCVRHHTLLVAGVCVWGGGAHSRLDSTLDCATLCAALCFCYMCVMHYTFSRLCV